MREEQIPKPPLGRRNKEEGGGHGERKGARPATGRIEVPKSVLPKLEA